LFLPQLLLLFGGNVQEEQDDKYDDPNGRGHYVHPSLVSSGRPSRPIKKQVVVESADQGA
jgi:hypothetical protein